MQVAIQPAPDRLELGWLVVVIDGLILLRHPARDEDRLGTMWPEWRIIGPHVRIAGELYRPDLLCGAS